MIQQKVVLVMVWLLCLLRFKIQNRHRFRAFYYAASLVGLAGVSFRVALQNSNLNNVNMSIFFTFIIF
ncbi:MAG TPA: hypothetical protein DCZ75_17775 [Geobacter sp.]|nr:hypothetical protein [Geobacter sp.]